VVIGVSLLAARRGAAGRAIRSLPSSVSPLCSNRLSRRGNLPKYLRGPCAFSGRLARRAAGPRAIRHKPGWIGEKPSWIGEKPGWIGEKSRGIGEKPGWIGEKPGWIGEKPRWIGEKPRWIGEKPRRIGEKPRGSPTRRRGVGSSCRPIAKLDVPPRWGLLLIMGCAHRLGSLRSLSAAAAPMTRNLNSGRSTRFAGLSPRSSRSPPERLRRTARRDGDARVPPVPGALPARPDVPPTRRGRRA
jgi:hypothetical protein